MTRRRARLAAVAVAAWALAAAPAAGVEGYPGSTWGNLRWELPSPGESDLVLEGWVRQGVAWRRWRASGARLALQTYGTFRYEWDSLGLDWNNRLGPGAGIALDLSAPRLPIVSAGVEYVHGWSTRSGDSAPYTAAFLDWFHWWDLRRGRWPGTAWGTLRWEIPNAGPDDLTLEGWVRQGWVFRRWRRAPLTWVLGPYARVRYRLDTLGLDWNNAVGPGAGLALDLEGVKGFQPSAGVEYAWEKNLASPGDVHRVEAFVRWYGWWDLARR